MVQCLILHKFRYEFRIKRNQYKLNLQVKTKLSPKQDFIFGTSTLSNEHDNGGVSYFILDFSLAPSVLEFAKNDNQEERSGDSFLSSEPRVIDRE